MDFKKFLAELESLKNVKAPIATKIKSHNLPVIVIGASHLAKRVTERLKSYGVDVSGYAVDGKYFKPDKTYLGLPIYNFDELHKTPKNYVFALGIGRKVNKGQRWRELLNDKEIILYDDFSSDLFCEMDCDYIFNNREKFIETFNLLADDFSKQTMIAYLKTHLTYGLDELSQVSVPDNYFNDLTRPDIRGGGIGFVDCGAFDGDTIETFVNFVNGNYEKIFAIEPDEKNFIALKKFVREKNYKNVECLNYGVWNKKDILSFKNEGNEASSISDDGDIKIRVDAIDNLVGNNKVDWIKMDLEGAELKALEGAKDTIKRFNPILTICVYHKKEDLITIPQFINSVSSDYKFYFRQHIDDPDLILYAVPK